MGETEVKDKATEATENETKPVAKEDLDKLLKYHVWASIGVGLVPIPLADFAGLTAIQLNLLRKLAKAYGVPFSKDKVKNILSSLAGGALPTVASMPLAASLTKFVPIVGQTVGAITLPVVAGATTYAVGRVFIQHFASGGTFLTFDPDQVKDYYAQMVKEGEKIAREGKNIATEMKAEEKSEPAKATGGSAKKDKKDETAKTTP